MVDHQRRLTDIENRYDSTSNEVDFACVKASVSNIEKNMRLVQPDVSRRDCDMAYSKPMVSRLESKFTEVSSDVSTLNYRMSNIRQTLSKPENSLEFMKNDTGSANTTISLLEIEGLKKQVTTLNADNACLQKDMTAVKSNVTIVQTDDGELKDVDSRRISAKQRECRGQQNSINRPRI